MSHTDSSIAVWPQSHVSSRGSKHARVVNQQHQKSRSDLAHAGKFVMGFVPRVFPRTLWLFKKMEKVNFKSQLLVYLSTVAGSKYGDRSWVNIQSALWVNIQSARTSYVHVI